MNWIRGLVAGLAGGIAWLVGIALFFGPAQAVQTDARLQSAKFLEVFTAEPLPRMSEAPWILPVGLVCIGMAWGVLYAWLSPAWPDTWWKRGLRFAVVSWVLVVPWFEFYLPWNAMREPALLVLLEMVCWAAVFTGVGLTIAGVDAVLRRRRRST